MTDPVVGKIVRKMYETESQSYMADDLIGLMCSCCGHVTPFSLSAVLVPLTQDHPNYDDLKG